MHVQRTVGRRQGLVSFGAAAAITAAAVLLAVGVAFVVHGKPTAPVVQASASQLSTQGAGVSKAAGPQVRELRERWPLGLQRVYDLDFSSGSAEGETDNDAVFGTARLSLVAQEVHPHGATLQAVFSDISTLNPEPDGGENPAVAEIERLRAELARPFLVFVTDRGAVEAVSVDPHLDNSSFGFIRASIASLQFIEPSGPNPNWDDWTVNETDNFGICAARYQRTATGQFKKTKQNYSFLEMTKTLAAPDGTPEKHKPLIASEAQMQVEGGGVPLKVTSRETVRVVWGERTLHSRQHLALKLSDTRQIQATLLNPVGWKREPLYATRMPSPESELANVRSKLGKASFSELLTDLTAVSKTKDATSQRADAVERMAALFQLHPEALREALRSLKKPLEREEAELLLAAMAMSKTPEAQRALTEVANDNALPAGLRQGAVVRLGLQQNPTEATLRSLGDLASGPDAKVRDGALLALGAAARHAADGENSGVAQRYVREIERSARTATSLEQRTLMLSALGNTASLDVLSTVRTALADPDPNVRSSAVSALRLMPGAEVDELIASTLARDPDAGVRRSAADACGVRPIQGALLAGLVTSLKQEKDAYVRLGVVAALAQSARTSSEVRALLSAAAKDDSASEVRAAAERAINPNSARER